MCGVRMTFGRPRSGERNSLAVARRLLGEDVDRGAEQVPVADRGRERLDVDHLAARGVDQDAPGCIARELGPRRSSARLRRVGDVERDQVARAEQLVEAGGTARRCPAAAWCGVVEEDVHAQGLGQHAELRADVAVADDAERLAAHLPAVRGRLDPPPRCAAPDFAEMPRISMMISPITSSATLRVFENGALKTGIAAPARRLERDLVGADAEAAHGDQPVGALQHARP